MTRARRPGTGTVALAATVLMIVGVSACGSGSPGAPEPSLSADQSPGGSSPATTSPASPLGRMVPPSAAPTTSRAGAVRGQAELSGTVVAGAESGCLVLTDAGGAVLANLIGLDTATTWFETTVVVAGEFQPGLMTTCQQGIPFDVSSIRTR